MSPDTTLMIVMIAVVAAFIIQGLVNKIKG